MRLEEITPDVEAGDRKHNFLFFKAPHLPRDILNIKRSQNNQNSCLPSTLHCA